MRLRRRSPREWRRSRRKNRRRRKNKRRKKKEDEEEEGGGVRGEEVVLMSFLRGLIYIYIYISIKKYIYIYRYISKTQKILVNLRALEVLAATSHAALYSTFRTVGIIGLEKTRYSFRIHSRNMHTNQVILYGIFIDYYSMREFHLTFLHLTFESLAIYTNLE